MCWVQELGFYTIIAEEIELDVGWGNSYEFQAVLRLFCACFSLFL